MAPDNPIDRKRGAAYSGARAPGGGAANPVAGHHDPAAWTHAFQVTDPPLTLDDVSRFSAS